MDPVQIKARRFRFVIVPPGLPNTSAEYVRGKTRTTGVVRRMIRKLAQTKKDLLHRSLSDPYVLMSLTEDFAVGSQFYEGN